MLRVCHWSLLCLIVLLAGCAAVPRPGGEAPRTTAPPYADWASVLQRHVDDQGRVNFAALARERESLDRFVAWVYDNGPNNQPQLFPSHADVLAFHLNAYNALAMHKVIERGIPETLAGVRKVFFFYLGPVQVGGQPITLYDYENKVIRRLKDARIHMALNCMSVGCPRLPREPFLPATLEAQLQRETRAFFDDPRHVRVDSQSRVLLLSEILAFFPEDFLAEAASLPDFVNRYRTQPVPTDFKIEYIPYDWTINRQPGT